MTVKFRLVYLPAMSILHKQKLNSSLVKIISSHRNLSFHSQGNLSGGNCSNCRSKGSIERVRILGPARSLSQVEVSWTDAMKLGLKPPLRISGDIQGSSPVTLIGPKGSVVLNEGLIIAQAHIHMSPADSARFQVVDGQSVQIKVEGIRPIILSNVGIRVSERYRLEMHIDTDEANAGLIQQGTLAEIVHHQVSEPMITVKEQSPVVQKVEQPSVYHYDKSYFRK